MPCLIASIPFIPHSVSVPFLGPKVCPNKWTNIAQHPARLQSRNLLHPVLVLDAAVFTDNEVHTSSEEDENQMQWVEFDPETSEEETVAFSLLDSKISKRCKALMKCIICFSSENSTLHALLASWVKAMKPRRADWLVILKEMKKLDSPLLLQVMEYALQEDSFEANIRDYTKIIDAYARQNQVLSAENAFLAMRKRGFSYDQVTLTVLIHMHSKAGDLKRAEEIFYELRLLGVSLDKRSYGAMIMAYIRAEMPELGEKLLIEMDRREIYATREVYKALLRAYSTAGNTEGTQRVFDAMQLAGIVPDAKIFALLINAFCVAGQIDKARTALENMKCIDLKPNDKCIAVMLAAYEKENCLEKAMSLLTELERESFILGEESYRVLEQWFDRLGLKNELQSIL